MQNGNKRLNWINKNRASIAKNQHTSENEVKRTWQSFHLVSRHFDVFYWWIPNAWRVCSPIKWKQRGIIQMYTAVCCVDVAANHQKSISWKAIMGSGTSTASSVGTVRRSSTGGVPNGFNHEQPKKQKLLGQSQPYLFVIIKSTCIWSCWTAFDSAAN